MSKTTKKTTAVVNATVAYEEGIVAVPLDTLVVPSDGNTTRPEGLPEVEALKASIAAVGLQTPVTVQRRDGGYVLAAGFCRVAACKALGFSTIPARVLADGSEAARVMANITENENSRTPISAMGRLAAYEALAAEGHSMAAVATITGRAEDFIRDHLRISKGADEVKAALMAAPDAPEYVSWAVCRLVLRFAKGEQPALLKKVAGLSVNKATAFLKAYRDAKKAPAEPTDEAEGEGTEGEGGDAPVDAEALLGASKVAKLAVPFNTLVGDAVAALRNLLDTEVPDVAQALKVINALAKGSTRFDDAIRKACGDEAVGLVEADLKAKQEAKAA